MEDTVRNFAIDWQDWSSQKGMSYAELTEWQNAIRALAKVADESGQLTEELKENGII